MNGISVSTIGSQARFWSRYCRDEKTAIVFRQVAAISMAIMAGAAVASLINEFFRDDGGRSNNQHDR